MKEQIKEVLLFVVLCIASIVLGVGLAVVIALVGMGFGLW